MIYERLCGLCKTNNTTPTALCVKITGSKGNLPTWKKGNIRSDYLLAIAKEFNVTTDYLLCKTDDPNPEESITGKIELPPDFEYSFYEGYREIDDDDRAILHNLMEKMRIAKKAKDSAQSTP